LLPPDLLGRYGGVSRLVIVADDAVQVAPFAAIDMAKPPEPYTPLAEGFELVKTKSAARYYGTTPVDDSRGLSDVVIFSNPVVERLPDLPSSATEADAIAQMFKRRVVQSFVGPHATKDALLSDDARAASVLH